MRTTIQRNAYSNQQKKIRDTKKFIDHFRAKATKARQVQSRIKALDRMEIIEDVTNDNNSINFHFNLKINPGRQVIQMKSVSKNYSDRKIFDQTDVHVERGDKIALIGPNGKGKSTWLRILAGMEVFEGERKTGYNVKVAFYAQHQLENLNAENDIITELIQLGSGRTENELRNLLGCFLFSGDDIQKKIKVLSGGEKARVALAKTLISEANFLLLDEPTNHLDFFSIGILKTALKEYKGSFVIVSHDRHFIEAVCNKIWHIDNLKIKTYPGKLSEFLYSQNLKKSPKKSGNSSRPHVHKNKKTVTGKNEHENREKELIILKKSIQDIDNKLNDLKKEKTQVETELEKPEIYSNPDKLSETLEILEKVNRKMNEYEISWMEAYHSLEKKSSGRF